MVCDWSVIADCHVLVGSFSSENLKELLFFVPCNLAALIIDRLSFVELSFGPLFSFYDVEDLGSFVLERGRV